MAFTSFRFIVFLVLAAAAYFLTPKRCRWVTLFVANYVFYFISGGRIFIYLLATTVTTYLATVKIGDMAAKNKIAFNEAKAELDKEGKKAWKAAFAKKKKRILIPTLLFNFGILAVLKYSGFVTENLNLLFAKIGIGTELPVFRFLLPLGISFYTFQSMGYLIDVYREKQEPERNFCKLALFISFFPQIVQGPISRFGTLAEQLFRANEFSYTRIKFGVQLMLWGAFKKMVIADRAAVLVDNAFGFPETFGGTYVAAAALAYAIQIYGDFSGGIDIATGAAQIFGVTLDKNFERPYLATNSRLLAQMAHDARRMVSGLCVLSLVPVEILFPSGEEMQRDFRELYRQADSRADSAVYHILPHRYLAWGRMEIYRLRLL